MFASLNGTAFRREVDMQDGALKVTQPATLPSPRQFLSRLRQVEELGVLIALVALLVLFGMLSPQFLRVDNLFQILRQISLLGIMSVGMTFVLSSGEIDLSVGSIFNISMVITALLLVAGLPWWLAVIVGLLAATLLGLANGLLAVRLNIPTIIITLGTMSVIRGFSMLLSDAKTISRFPRDNLFFAFGEFKLGSMPIIALVMIICVVLGSILLNRTVFGRHVLSVGSNLKAALHSGIQVTRTRLLVLALMGFLCGIAGMLALSYLQTADPGTGLGYELDVIAAVIIGGTKLSGGKGTVIGSIIGTAIMGTLRNGLIMASVSLYWQTVITGAVIIVAVAVDRLVKRN
jgi:ribose transport system permease protein